LHDAKSDSHLLACNNSQFFAGERDPTLVMSTNSSSEKDHEIRRWLRNMCNGSRRERPLPVFLGSALTGARFGPPVLDGGTGCARVALEPAGIAA
jgi:hypothetical protein